jgi:hypothetical protein
MRIAAIFVLGLALGACKQDRTADAMPVRPGDPGWTSSSGEVSLTEGEKLSFEITSERYKAWDAARTGLDSRIASKYGAILQPGSPSRRNIEKAVQYLESEPAAKASIERAGMSVRDFVVTTVALEQEMRLASARGELPPDTMPTPPVYTAYPMDTSSFGTTTYVPVPLPQPVPVVRQYVDTFPRPDTTPPGSFVITRTDTSTRRFPIADSIARAAAKRDSLARALPPRDTIVRRDTVIRRDTVVPRDTIVKRDSAPTPPRDTAPPRDTITAIRLRG